MFISVKISLVHEKGVQQQLMLFCFIYSDLYTFQLNIFTFQGLHFGQVIDFSICRGYI